MSKLFTLNLRDLLKGCVTAILTAVVAYLYDVVQTGDIQLTLEILKQVGSIAAIAGIGYLLKNLLTNSKGKIFGAF